MDFGVCFQHIVCLTESLTLNFSWNPVMPFSLASARVSISFWTFVESTSFMPQRMVSKMASCTNIYCAWKWNKQVKLNNKKLKEKYISIFGALNQTAKTFKHFNVLSDAFRFASSRETFVQEQYLLPRRTYQFLLSAIVVTCCVNNNSFLPETMFPGLFTKTLGNIHFRKTLLGNNQTVLVHLLGNMTRKQCFLVCLFSGMIAEKKMFRICMSSGKHGCERTILLLSGVSIFKKQG